MGDRWGKACSPYVLILIVPVFVLLSYWRSTESTGAAQSALSDPVQANIPVLLRYVNHESAQCLDGSKPAYYYRQGYGEGADKWIVFFEGGGWCYDLEQCYLRSKTILGSSKNYPLTLDSEVLKFYLSNNERTNPLMYNWNTVLVKYCDGSSYAGDAIQSYKGRDIYFKGRINRDETIRSLFYSDHKPQMDQPNINYRSHNMSTASEVVIGGCSAGALGIFMGLDAMADIVRNTARQFSNNRVVVRGFADSGFFMEHTSNYRAKMTHHAYGKDDAVTVNSIHYNQGKNYMDYATCMRDLFQFMNLSGGVNQGCIQTQQQKQKQKDQLPGRQATISGNLSFGVESNCVFAAHLAPHIKTPMFLLQPQYDYWQILHIFSQAYTSAEVNAYGRNLVSKLKISLFHAKHPGHGVFIDSCAHHCTSCSDETENTWSGNFVRSTGPVASRISNVTDRSDYGRNGSAVARSDSVEADRSVNNRLNAHAADTHYNEAEAFAMWYAHSLLLSPSLSPSRTDIAAGTSTNTAGTNSKINSSGLPVTPGINWFFQDRPYPCAECCKCSVDMIGRLRKVHPV